MECHRARERREIGEEKDKREAKGSSTKPPHQGGQMVAEHRRNGETEKEETAALDMVAGLLRARCSLTALTDVLF